MSLGLLALLACGQAPESNQPLDINLDGQIDDVEKVISRLYTNEPRQEVLEALSAFEEESITAHFQERVQKTKDSTYLMNGSALLIYQSGLPYLYPLADGPSIIPDNVSNVQYFIDDYDVATSAFKRATQKLKDQGLPVQQEEIQFIYESEEPGKIPVVYIPAQGETKQLVVLLSGTHGVEGVAGSALQRWLMDHINEVKPDTGIVLIHGYNPWGWRHDVRVSDGGVDPNRNAIRDGQERPENAAFESLYGFLGKSGEYSSEDSWHRFFTGMAFYHILMSGGISVFRQAVMQGQYQHSNGVSYGGTENLPQLALVEQAIQTYARDYEKLRIVDIHTGYGEANELYLLSANPSLTAGQRATVKTDFGDDVVFMDEDPDFFQTNGDLITYLCSNRRSLGDCLSIAMEFGTTEGGLDTLPQINSLETMIGMQQYAVEGVRPEDSVAIRTEINAFLRPQGDWRYHVMDKGTGFLSDMFCM